MKRLFIGGLLAAVLIMFLHMQLSRADEQELATGATDASSEASELSAEDIPMSEADKQEAEQLTAAVEVE